MQSSESMFQNYLRYYLKLSTETMSLYTYNCAESRDRLLRISEWNVSRVLLLIPLSAFILLFSTDEGFCFFMLLPISVVCFFATGDADFFYCCLCCCCCCLLFLVFFFVFTFVSIVIVVLFLFCCGLFFL